MTPETAHPPARHGHHPSARRGGAAEPSIPVGTSAGLRANVLSFILALASGLAQGWALISLGRGLGDLLPGVEGGAWRSHLAMAAAAAVLACAGQLMVEAIARSSAAEQEGAIRTRLLGHIFALGPARAAESRSGASVSLLTDGAERVALYRQTFLAPTVAACLSPALVLVLLAATVDWVPAAVLMIAVVLVPGAIIGLHSKVRRSSAKSRAQRFRLAAEYLDAIQGLTTLTLARAARRRAADLRRAGEDNRRAVMGLLAGNQLVILVTDCLFSLFFVTAAVGMALGRLASGAIAVGDALAIALVSYVLLEPLDHVGAFFYVGMGGMANQRVMRRLLAAERPGGSPARRRRRALPAAAQPSAEKSSAEPAQTVRQPAGVAQQAHGGINQRIAGCTLLPSDHQRFVGLSGCGAVFGQAVLQHIGILAEIMPPKFAPCQSFAPSDGIRHVTG